MNFLVIVDNDARIAQANGRLKAGGIRARIQPRRDSLFIRATFPPKPGESQSKQRDLAVGIKINPAGIKLAEAKAKEIGGLLDAGRFDWSPYLKKIDSTSEKLTLRYWVRRFTDNYFESREQSPNKISNFNKEYEAVFRHLPLDEPINEQALRLAILSKSQPETRSRKRYVMVCSALAKFAGLECDFKPLQGNYNSKKVSPRDIPSDELIEKLYFEIDNPQWRWVFGMLATYGLRPHEIFRLDCFDIKDKRVVHVLTNTKTRERDCYPCPSSWVEKFELWDVRCPNYNYEVNTRLGHVISKNFREKLKIPFPPYHLRHAYAGRTAALGVEVAIASKWMGHSVSVHTSTYHAFLSEQHNAQAFELMKQVEKMLKN